MKFSRNTVRTVVVWLSVWAPIVLTSTAYADDGMGPVKNFIQNIIDILVSICGLIAVVFIIIGGYKYMTCRNDPQKLESAKHTLVEAGIGLAIVIAAKVIEGIVSSAATKAFGS